MHVEKKSELRNLLKSGDKRCKLVEPRNAKSCVWRFFNLVSCDDRIEPYACCKTCGDLLSYSGKTGTGSLLRHRCLHTTNEKTSRIAKAKVVREPLRVAKPKIDAHSSIAGALPQKWEEYEQNEEISEDIKDIIYSEDPLCYSPIQVVEDEMLDTGDKVTVMSSNTRTTTAPVVATVVSATPTNAAKTLKNNLETSIERLTTVSEQLNYIIQQQQEQQTKDDDYYFALSLVPIMRQLSVSRKLYVRSKIHEILYKESEETSPKSE
ncbi:uncharacterized protein LOC133844759 isoform X2 [Drosophila sulfurigaster albostrigata]|uniref:uncharacterized protein LOC133844759 isoform X2 n=1 Tax=Drosophila sulfurigaster albostrigata TaxID=89887 RepID=UPI002D219CB1|nr:uncharacterized protein LOC133844759 isoform X2 [Drosophila sulfurigaster albostrigata]